MVTNPLPVDERPERTLYAWFHRETGGWLRLHPNEGAGNSASWVATKMPHLDSLYATQALADEAFPTHGVMLPDDPTDPATAGIGGPTADLDRADFALANVHVEVEVYYPRDWCSPKSRSQPHVCQETRRGGVDKISFEASWMCCQLKATVPVDLGPDGWRALHDTMKAQRLAEAETAAPA